MGRTSISSADGWELENNPCSWGSTNPRNLLLGFSKGTRQTENILRRQHDDVAYAGFRRYLTPALQILGLLSQGDTIDAHIRSDEPDWGFGSLVRCGMAKDGKKSGTIIPESTQAGSHDRWFDTCTSR